MIPVDIAAKEIYLLSVQDEQEISTYHITSENTLCVADVLRAARQCIGLPVVEYVSRERFESQNINIMAKKLFLTFEPYLTFRTVFRNKDTLKKLKRLGYVPKTMGREILAKLFDFAKKKRYLKRMGKRQ